MEILNSTVTFITALLRYIEFLVKTISEKEEAILKQKKIISLKDAVISSLTNVISLQNGIIASDDDF
jgi:hypothetical protein